MSSNYRKPWYRNKSSNYSNKPPNNNPPSNVADLSTYGLYGFNLYFPDIDSADVEKITKNTNSFKKYITKNYSHDSLKQIKKAKYFAEDYKVISTEDELNSEWVNFEKEILSNTEYCLSCMGLAMHQFIAEDEIQKFEDEEREYNEQKIVKIIGLIRARLVNYEPVVQIRDLNVNYYGKLVAIRGTVIKAGTAKTICNYMTFSCSLCTGTQILKQIDGNYTVPSKCQTQGCRVQSNFVPLHNSSFTRTVSWQPIRIQELLENECENARIPRTLECELTEDLVKSCIPGDDVTITGIIKVRDPNDNKGKNKQHSVFVLYLDAISIFNNKNQSAGSYGASDRITFNVQDHRGIQLIHSKENLFRLLVQSLCPSIYGHEIVKAGLLLALFGGTKGDDTRSESHVLVVGDPGLGKSMMLQACANVAPKGVYVCGNMSSSSGLTVTMTKESGGDYALEAGALMLSDQGCCCIDEFDKMPTQHACLLEAMEQQSISIAKARIVCTIPTKVTVLAAANPADGHYNKAKTISENLKISSPMLSRFDLIFILLDTANEEMDKLLSKHVLAQHSGSKTVLQVSDFEKAGMSFSGDNSLRERLKSTGEMVDCIPHTLFRKYIAYAQKYVNPLLSDGAKHVLKQFYLQLRKQFQTGDCTPVTTRQLNSLVRLTQARAKAELREEATVEDALDVVDIMKHSLIDIFTDESGGLDKTRSQLGTGMSSKNKVMKLLKILQKKSEIETRSLFTIKEIKEASEEAGNTKDFSNILNTLNVQGFLLYKGQSKYQLVCADL